MVRMLFAEIPLPFREIPLDVSAKSPANAARASYLCNVTRKRKANTKQTAAMKRMFMISAMMMAMFMASADVVAQSQGRGRGNVRAERREYNGNAPRPDSRDRVRREDRKMHRPLKPRDHRRAEFFVPRGGRLVKCAPPRVKRGCYVPGWEGRVRYLGGGRWGYYIDGYWRYCNCYYNPYEFFCVPVPPPAHLPVY